jgi:hypothetical protein
MSIALPEAYSQSNGIIKTALQQSGTNKIGSDNQFITYNDPVLGIKFDYPKDATVQPNRSPSGSNFLCVSFSGSDSRNESLLIGASIPLKGNETLKDVAHEFLVSTKVSNPDALYDVHVNKSKISGNIDAYETLVKYNYTENISNKKTLVQFNNLEVDAIKDGLLYQINYKATPELFETNYVNIKKIIDSFQILDLFK